MSSSRAKIRAIPSILLAGRNCGLRDEKKGLC
jgi:hypothetical protein